MLVYDEERGDGPRTHAFVVGVGDYRFQAEAFFKQHYGDMSALSSPTQSALAFSNWLLSSYQDRHYGDAPLASLELLLSPAEGEVEASRDVLSVNEVWDDVDLTHPELAASLSHFRSAFGDFRDRVSEHPENVAIVYFVGHGLGLEARNAQTGVFFMLEDAGHPDELHEPFRHCVDVMACRHTMLKNTKNRQFWFLDMCRSRPEASHFATFSPQSYTGGITPRSDTATPPRYNENSAVFLAASDQDQALGLKNAPSLFCESLLWALERGAVVSSNDFDCDWWVTSSSIASSVDDFVHSLLRPWYRIEYHTQRPRLISGEISIPFLQFDEQPEADVFVQIGTRADTDCRLDISRNQQRILHRETRRLRGGVSREITVPRGELAVKVDWSAPDKPPTTYSNERFYVDRGLKAIKVR